MKSTTWLIEAIINFVYLKQKHVLKANV